MDTTCENPPEPGTVEDLSLGIPGEAEEMAADDADLSMVTQVNDDEPEEDE